MSQLTGKKFAQTSWSIEDIKELRPKWTDEQCAKFLEEHENGLQEAGVAAGWDIIHDALGYDPDEEDEGE